MTPVGHRNLPGKIRITKISDSAESQDFPGFFESIFSKISTPIDITLDSEGYGSGKGRAILHPIVDLEANNDNTEKTYTTTLNIEYEFYSRQNGVEQLMSKYKSKVPVRFKIKPNMVDNKFYLSSNESTKAIIKQERMNRNLVLPSSDDVNQQKKTLGIPEDLKFVGWVKEDSDYKTGSNIIRSGAGYTVKGKANYFAVWEKKMEPIDPSIDYTGKTISINNGKGKYIVKKENLEDNFEISGASISNIPDDFFGRDIEITQDIDRYSDNSLSKYNVIYKSADKKKIHINNAKSISISPTEEKDGDEGDTLKVENGSTRTFEANLEVYNKTLTGEIEWSIEKKSGNKQSGTNVEEISDSNNVSKAILTIDPNESGELTLIARSKENGDIKKELKINVDTSFDELGLSVAGASSTSRESAEKPFNMTTDDTYNLKLDDYTEESTPSSKEVNIKNLTGNNVTIKSITPSGDVSVENKDSLSNKEINPIGVKSEKAVEDQNTDKIKIMANNNLLASGDGNYPENHTGSVVIRYTVGDSKKEFTKTINVSFNVNPLPTTQKFYLGNTDGGDADIKYKPNKRSKFNLPTESEVNELKSRNKILEDLEFVGWVKNENVPISGNKVTGQVLAPASQDEASDNYTYYAVWKKSIDKPDLSIDYISEEIVINNIINNGDHNPDYIISLDDSADSTKFIKNGENKDRHPVKDFIGKDVVVKHDFTKYKDPSLSAYNVFYESAPSNKLTIPTRPVMDPAPSVNQKWNDDETITREIQNLREDIEYRKVENNSEEKWIDVTKASDGAKYSNGNLSDISAGTYEFRKTAIQGNRFKGDAKRLILDTDATLFEAAGGKSKFTGSLNIYAESDADKYLNSIKYSPKKLNVKYAEKFNKKVDTTKLGKTSGLLEITFADGSKSEISIEVNVLSRPVYIDSSGTNKDNTDISNDPNGGEEKEGTLPSYIDGRIFGSNRTLTSVKLSELQFDHADTVVLSIS